MFAWKRSETFRNVVIGVFNAVKAVVVAVWNVIKAVVGVVVAAITAYINAYRAVVLAVWGAIRGGAVAAWNAISGAVRAVISRVTGFVSGMKSKIISLFSGAGSFLRNAGTRIISGLWDGLKAQWERVKAWFSSITNQIPKLKGPAAKDKKLLEGSGKLIIAGFQKGLEKQYPQVEKSLAGFTDGLSASATVGGSISATPLIDTAAQARAGGTSPATVIELRSSGSKVDDMLLTLLRDAIRTRGGNPQIVLSRAG